jgi:RNA polymerase sigma-70 factor (sigma-E family)
MVGVRREQEAAFEAFVAGCGSRLLRLAVLLTGDRWHGEDLLQTALERTARHWSRLDGSPEAYAHRVLANLATDRWRRLAARVREVGADHPHVHERAAMTGVGSGDPATGVALRQALMTALQELPPRQRAVVVLRYFCDLSEAETAEALGIGVGGVKSAGSRGLARLRGSVDLDEHPGPAAAHREQGGLA